MLKHIFSYSILAIVLGLSSCSSTEYSGDVLTQQIEYAVPIGNPVVEEYDPNWLNKEVRSDFLKDLLDKVKDGELQPYYYFSDTLIPMEKMYVDEIFFRVDTEYVEVGDEIMPVPIEESLDLDAIVKLKFMERWYYNSSSNEFFKKVIAVCPMVERYKNEKEILGYQGLFWIYLDKEITQNLSDK